MAKTPLRVVLDTNVLVSSFLFGGKPRNVLFNVLTGGVVGITSQILLAELSDLVTKKFKIEESDVKLIESQMRKNFKIVLPKQVISLLKDDPDNRVLEAAVEGECDLIITGDRDLLRVKKYKKTRIITISEFLDLISSSN